MVFPSWLYLVVYLTVVCIACNFTIACLRFDACFRMYGGGRLEMTWEREVQRVIKLKNLTHEEAVIR
jgi:hypothetical protein